MKIKKILNCKCLSFFKFIFLLFMLLSFSSIILSILKILGINVDDLSAIKKIIFSLFTDIIFLVFIIFIYRKTLIKDWQDFTKNFSKNIEYAFKYWFIGVIIMVISNLLIQFIFPTSVAGNEESIRKLIKIAPIYMVFSASIYAPLTEELIFRKSIRDFIKNKYVYILTSGIIFGSLHVIGSITQVIDFVYLIPYCALGITFALLYYNSKNIFSTISMHALHNTITMILYIFILLGVSI